MHYNCAEFQIELQVTILCNTQSYRSLQCTLVENPQWMSNSQKSSLLFYLRRFELLCLSLAQSCKMYSVMYRKLSKVLLPLKIYTKKKIIYLAFVPLIIVILIQVKCLLFNAAILHTPYSTGKVIRNIVGYFWWFKQRQ